MIFLFIYLISSVIISKVNDIWRYYSILEIHRNPYIKIPRYIHETNWKILFPLAGIFTYKLGRFADTKLL